MSTTVCSPDDYVIVIDTAGSATTRFFKVDDGYGTTFLAIADDGEMAWVGKVNYDTGPAIIKTSSTSVVDLCRFTGAGTSGVPLRVNRTDGSTRLSEGELVLPAGTGTTISGQGDGDIYWYDDGTDWHLRAYWNSGWTALSTTSC